ncbi:telomere length regulation protein TEL2 homolog [Schistocerca gregaria]|uniref:telomere length regulation protein TEL2 homolog n=1 Tax=Schistocerca gregaria TaxID=7010 RepID=UPI00211E26F9|nr:telomere length regulation protein TEL2 homolog [Schistocerca gregaria]
MCAAERTQLLTVWIRHSDPLIVLVCLSKALRNLDASASATPSHAEAPSLASYVQSIASVAHARELVGSVVEFFELEGADSNELASATDRRPAWTNLVLDLLEPQKNEQRNALWHATVCMISSLPNLAANLMKRDTPASLNQDVFLANITNSLLQLIETDKIGEKPLDWIAIMRDFPFLATWISQHTSRPKPIWETIYRSICHSEREILKKINVVFLKLHNRALEPMLRLLLTTSKPPLFQQSTLSALLDPLVRQSSQTQFLLSNKFILCCRLSDNVLYTLIDFLHHTFDHEETRTTWLDMVVSLAQTFGDPDYVKKTHYHHQARVVKALCYICKKYLRRSDIEGTELLSGLMKGVQEHMASPDSRHLNMAMMLGDAFSTTLLPESSIKFEYTPLEETPDTASDQDQSEELADHPPPSVQQDQARDLDDPDLDYFAYLDLKESLQKNAAVPSDPQKKTDCQLHASTSSTSGLYLRTSIANLRTNDPDTIQNTLSVLDALIDSHPDELGEVAVTLTLTLIHLFDEYELDQFREKKHRALVALIRQETKTVVDCLVEQLFEPNYTLQQRYDILDALIESARHLSSNATTLAPHSGRRSLFSTSNSDIERSAEGAPPPGKRSGALLRRGTPRPAQTPTVNKFALYANQFFGILDFCSDDTFQTPAEKKFDPKGDPRMLGMIVNFALPLYDVGDASDGAN